MIQVRTHLLVKLLTNCYSTNSLPLYKLYKYHLHGTTWYNPNNIANSAAV